jgi:hypothetical protein
MGTWGPGNFDSDASLDFINEEMDRHVRAIEAIMADPVRLRLDEDAEGELMPRVVLLTLLCEQCHGILAEGTDVASWKARYLAMYDDTIDALEPDEAYKTQRRAVIAETFDRLIAHQRA